MKKLIISFILTLNTHAICVHEYEIKGHNLLSQIHTMNEEITFYQQQDGTYREIGKLKEIGPSLNYRIQVNQSNIKKDYNDRYIQYYSYQRIQDFLTQSSQALKQHGYKTEVIGKSLEGRNLFAIAPEKLDPNKEIILMFARHHGDEGTANWIVEGFLNKVLDSKEFNSKFQLVLYPMVNPDGAEAKRRYNKKGRDLNRSWGSTPSRSSDEISTIQAHLNRVLLSKRKPLIALDMHGSFTEDFIYRVSKRFAGQAFYNKQQRFITDLGQRDNWQKGNFHTSNGHKKMARILMVRDYQVNALTHETIRDIPLSESRTLQDLFTQGEVIVDSLIKLY